MIRVEDFNHLIDRAMQTGSRSHMRPVIVKELMANKDHHGTAEKRFT